jgi:phthiocerol/phenolphthiocerol synthesis type-I polyketide synthase C
MTFSAHTTASIQAWLFTKLSDEFGLDSTVLAPHHSFDSLGLASRDVIMLSGDVEEWLGISLSPIVLYEYPTIGALATFLAQAANSEQSTANSRYSSTLNSEPSTLNLQPSTFNLQPSTSKAVEPIAIVGMACRFPGAAGLDDYWRLLVGGEDAIGPVPAERWSQAELEALLAGKRSLPSGWGGFLEGVDQFDAAHFGISPREAIHIDPQQRLLLEVAWDALADAGLLPADLAGSATGVFVGISHSEYGQAQLGALDRINSYMGTGSALSIAANRLSYYFDWRGPSLAVDTACSSSLVAVHLACQSLRQGEASLALAAGANLILSPAVTVNFSEAGAMAADGRCKAFDARADGYVRSEGVGVAVLKPLSMALADGDRIYALILGSAVNQDGRTNGLMAPNPAAQEEVLRAAYRQAGVSPGAVAYVESHGTGTFLGDPIEAKALGTVLRQERRPGFICRIGSVKSNIGHLEAAAGIAGLIKVALALSRRQLPASLHYETANPHIPFESLPLRVQQQLEPWPEAEQRIAGLSSFGFGGSNAHAVLAAVELAAGQESVALPAAQAFSGRRHLLTFSARTPEALQATAARWRDWLAEQAASEKAPSWRAVCHTAACRRSHLEERLALVAADTVEASQLLDQFLAGEVDARLAIGSARSERRPRPVFICPGQGSQWVGMARQLWQEAPVFRHSLVETAVAFEPFVDWDLEECLFAEELSERIDVIQPLLFAVSVALAELWRSLGVTPGAVTGHSMGEVAAAHIAGVLSLTDAARVICGRSRLLRRLEGGGLMALVALSPEEVERRLQKTKAGDETWQPSTGGVANVTIAAVNGPHSVVLSGETAALEALLRQFEADNVFCRRIKVDVASHSPQVDVLRDELLDLLAPLRPQPGRLPIYSTVTGAVLNGPEMDAAYWADNLRQPVLFATAVERLHQDGYDTFIELSSHPVLLPSVPVASSERRLQVATSGSAERPLLIASMRREQDEWVEILAGLGALHANGYPVTWSALYPERRPPVSLPAHTWQRERFWFQPRATGSILGSRTAADGHPLLGAYLPQAADRQSHLWQTELDLERLPYLADHRVWSRALMPAAGYLEMVTAAVRDRFGARPFYLKEVRFTEFLPLSEAEPPLVQTAVLTDQPRQATFHVASLAGNRAGDWTRHAGGLIAFDDDPPVVEDLPDLSVLRRRCLTFTQGSDFYAGLTRRQLDYGAAFQRISGIWQGDGEALAQLDAGAGDEVYHLPPALLDACFQSLAAAMPATLLEQTAGRLMLPVGIDRFIQIAPAAAEGTCWSYARSHTETGVGGDLSGDVFLLDEQGLVVAAALGMRVRLLGTPATPLATGDNWFYTLEWQEQPLDSPTLAAPAAGWLIFARPDTALSEQLPASFEAAGQEPTLVFPGSEFRRLASNRYQVNAGNPRHFEQLLDSLAAANGVVYRGVVQGWGLGAGVSQTPEAMAEEQTLSTLASLHLAQALAGAAWRVSPRLFLLTAAVVDGGDESSLATAALPGLARVINSEHPELACTTIELRPQPEAKAVVALVRECLAGSAEKEVALGANGRRVARLRPWLQAGAAGSDMAADGPYRLQMEQVGTLDTLSWQPVARQAPRPHEVEIAVAAAGLNFLDLLSAMGTRPDQAGRPLSLGAECAGRITAVGEDVTDLAPGDEVVTIAPQAFANLAIMDARLVVSKPAALTFAAAATLPVAFTTAYYALHEVARLRPGERVLIHSAAGGTGLAAVQVARYLGAEILATAGSEEKRAYLRGLGIQHVMDSRSLDFADEVRLLTGGEGVDVVLNSLAGEAINAGLSLLRPRGRFLEIGKRDIYANERLGLHALRHNISLSLIDLAQIAADDPAYAGDLLRQVVSLIDQGKLEPLPHESFAAGDVKEMFRRMARARHVGKLVVSLASEANEAAAPRAGAAGETQIRSDATYLITGGLGGIGLQVAAYLVEQGARHLALLGRRPPTTEAETALEQLRQMGATVAVFQADVSDAAQLTAVFDEMRRRLPALRGIFHAAGLLDDGILRQQTAARFEAVLAPKVQGGWLLHHLSLKDPLDYFVLFSSVAAVFGSPGQGNHAAANAFLDGLAHYRRARRLPAVSINWGPWAVVGAAVGKRTARRVTESGMAAVSPERGVELLGQLLAGSPAQVVVMAVDWPRWFRSYPAGAQTPLLALMAADAGLTPGREKTAGNESRLAFVARLRALALPRERRQRLEEFVREQAARVLRQPPAQIDSHTPFGSLGFDSLMGLELKNTLERHLELVLPVALVWNYPTVAEMAAYLAGQLGLGLQDEAEVTTPATAPEERRAAEIADLSDAEVLKMLEEKLGALQHSGEV